jgi:hypothetical protein
VRLGRAGLVRAPSGVLVELERVREVLVVDVAVLKDEADGSAARGRRSGDWVEKRWSNAE